MKITVQARKSGLIGKGLHECSIQSIVETTSKSGTPQLEMTLINKAKLVRKYWFNLRGFKKNAKDQFIDSKNRVIELESLKQGSPEHIAALSKRVEDPLGTEKAMKILGTFAGDIGFDVDDDINTDDFVGRKVYALVTADGVEGEIKYIFGEHKLESAEFYASKVLGYDVTLADSEENFASI